MRHPNAVRIEGHVSAGFEVVREAFAENFSRRHELGGACCVYYRGEKVVDLWGGVRNKETGEPWEEDTMVLVYSATKGLAAMTLAIAHSRGWLDYDERLMGDGVQFSLGFMKHGQVWSFGNEGSFGSPGTGGSLGFADPKAGIGYAYVTSKVGTAITGDPREVALRNAVYAIIPPSS
jgi:CubicO group peptidase (beta-lactamase class C family)